MDTGPVPCNHLDDQQLLVSHIIIGLCWAERALLLFWTVCLEITHLGTVDTWTLLQVAKCTVLKRWKYLCTVHTHWERTHQLWLHGHYFPAVRRDFVHLIATKVKNWDFWEESMSLTSYFYGMTWSCTEFKAICLLGGKKKKVACLPPNPHPKWLRIVVWIKENTTKIIIRNL